MAIVQRGLKSLRIPFQEQKRDFPSDACAFERKGGLIIFLQFISFVGHLRKRIAKTLQTPAVRLGGICPEL